MLKFRCFAAIAVMMLPFLTGCAGVAPSDPVHAQKYHMMQDKGSKFGMKSDGKDKRPFVVNASMCEKEGECYITAFYAPNWHEKNYDEIYFPSLTEVFFEKMHKRIETFSRKKYQELISKDATLSTLFASESKKTGGTYGAFTRLSSDFENQGNILLDSLIDSLKSIYFDNIDKFNSGQYNHIIFHNEYGGSLTIYFRGYNDSGEHRLLVSGIDTYIQLVYAMSNKRKSRDPRNYASYLIFDMEGHLLRKESGYARVE